MRILSLLLVILFLPTTTFSEPPKNFDQAKRLAREIFSDMRITVYCGCNYDRELNVDQKSCGYTPRKNEKRASKVQWEHVYPAENFGRAMESKCWTEPVCEKKNGDKYKGRGCCLKIDSDFRKMHNDLHNIIPIVGELNMDRKNFQFSMLESSDGNYGDCNFKISFKSKRVEPRDEAKGVVARASLYFQKEYNVNISDQQKKLFDAWNKQFPPEQWEITWDDRVYETQGNHNNYISEWEKYVTE